MSRVDCWSKAPIPLTETVSIKTNVIAPIRNRIFSDYDIFLLIPKWET